MYGIGDGVPAGARPSAGRATATVVIVPIPLIPTVLGALLLVGGLVRLYLRRRRLRG